MTPPFPSQRGLDLYIFTDILAVPTLPDLALPDGLPLPTPTAPSPTAPSPTAPLLPLKTHDYGTA